MNITEETRRDAHAFIEKVATQAQLSVLRHLRWQGPATTTELARRMGMQLLTVRPRMTELKQAGLVVAVGRREGCAIFRALTQEEINLKIGEQPELF